MPQIQMLDQPRMGRRTRRPQHPFSIKQRPWQIQPFLLAPVLPGETMKNFLMQARVVSDPVKHPLIGWWQEFYVFYVKHRDLAEREKLTRMVLDPEFNATTEALTSAAAVPFYHNSGINWANLCLARVVEEYFRDEGDTAVYLIDTLPVAKIGVDNWITGIRTGNEEDADDVSIVVGADDIITTSELDAAMRSYEFMRLNNLTTMSYEDFLGTYGVKVGREELHRPELVRYVREWTYPTNHIDPATGAPTSALSWSIAEKADKDRFFREPGFIFGVTVSRPKVYLGNQAGQVASQMMDAYSWLPAVLSDDPMTSMKNFATLTGPLNNAADDYWIDLRDLFLYGDQFLNYAMATAEADGAAVDLPTAALQHQYANAAMADALFVTPLSANKIRSDGLVSLSIASSLRETTPPG